MSCAHLITDLSCEYCLRASRHAKWTLNVKDRSYLNIHERILYGLRFTVDCEEYQSGQHEAGPKRSMSPAKAGPSDRRMLRYLPKWHKCHLRVIVRSCVHQKVTWLGCSGWNVQ